MQLSLIRNKIISYKPELIDDFEKMINEYEMINPFVVNPSEHGFYTFANGYSPWKLMLKKNSENEFESIKTTILYELSKNGVSKCKRSPENGTVVLALDKGNIYRAYILEIINRIYYRIMNIDTGDITTVTIDSLNDLPKSLAIFPPQVIQCTLLKDRFYEKYWNDHFSKMFKTIMKTMKYTVTILEQVTINPPCFEIHLTGIRNGKDINITPNWLYKIFFRNIDTCAGEFDLLDYDLYELEENRRKQLNGEVNLDENYVDDSEFIRNAFESFSRKYLNEGNTSRRQQEVDDGNDDTTSDDEYKENIAFLKAVFRENLKDVNSCKVQTSPTPKEDGYLPDLDDDFSKVPLLETDFSGDDEKMWRFQIKEEIDESESLIVQENDKDLSNLNGQDDSNVIHVTSEEKNCRLQISPNIEEKDLHLEDNIRECKDEENIWRFNEEEPIINVSSSEIDAEENMSDLCYEYGNDIALLEADIGEECDDEVKTCKFQLKDGFCWKEFCPREHINPGPAYIGSTWTYSYFDGEYPLPEEKEIIFVKPKMIVSGHIFFGHLINHIKWNQPDLKLLEIRMNTKEEYIRFEHFLYSPTIGELCLAYGKSKRWYRARIVEADDIEVQVLSVDYGYGEKVSLKNIRKMKNEYLFLPPQAIRCELYGIKAIDDKEIEAKQYFRDVALNETLKAVVRESYLQDSFIEISLICPNGLAILANLIAKGYYTKAESTEE
ncbi:hypothetical protein O3M35_002420 [Rhynocoris fuscipes]|uniref:Tudor domain-containing protein n=1 Tax=Rhynocoris fuscipes TaxID=488301 RepID=A0AAW1CM21_9HEMI